MESERASGILLHPTSLPGRFGIGDLGESAYEFVDFLLESGQSLWQVLPLSPPGFGDSPYQSFSAFAGNTLLISPELVARDGLLSDSDLSATPDFPSESVDYGRVIPYRRALLEKAFSTFLSHGTPGIREDFDRFRRHSSHWLDDYALFRAIQQKEKGLVWNRWGARLARRDPRALSEVRELLRDSIEFYSFGQYMFFRQWMMLKRHCNERKIRIVGDVPIFVAHDSADVWSHPELFKLNSDGSPEVVAGVPPDYFSETGQLWGNPVYDWRRMSETGFKWWIERLRWVLELADIQRIDHFRGFVATWEVPAGSATAERGQWVEAPGRELFRALAGVAAELPIIAEDLGVITPEVTRLRDELGFPGMRVLQFAFDGDPDNANLPHNFERTSVVYAGTHDTDTVVGWFNSRPGIGSVRTRSEIRREKELALAYLNSNGREINWDFIRLAFASVADLAITPLQDVLGLGSDARMNQPGNPEGNWRWRYTGDRLEPRLAARLRELTELYGRLPRSAAGAEVEGKDT